MEQANRSSKPESGVKYGAVPSGWAGGRSVLGGAFGLLAALEEVGEAGLTRLAAECGLPKTTAHRLLEQMVDLGVVDRRGGRYRMGTRMFQLGQGWQPYPGLRTAALEPMRRLAAVTGATASILVLHQGQSVVPSWVPGEPEMLAELRNCVTGPWFTAGGKVLLAAAYPRMPLGPMPASWQREAPAIRDRGVAFDREEVVAGVCCVAVPVYGTSGVAVASLSLLVDSSQHLERLAETVRRAGAAISTRLRRR